jgi:hypothetical protein
MDKKGWVAVGVLGLGAAITAVVLGTKKASAAPGGGGTLPAGDNLGITLINYDPLATVWEMEIFPNDYSSILSTPGQDVPITTSAAFNVPASWLMPLKISLNVYKDTVPGVSTTLTQIYGVQSYRATNTFTGQPDPTYSPIYITSLGSWTFDVNAGKFQKIS